jgi:hypothetical protein
MKWRRLLCSLLLTIAALEANAADSLLLVASRPMSARLTTSDDLGNIYTIHIDNILARYNDKGDSTGFYRSTLNGEISFVDATNPLRILLYYPSFNKVALLDRQMALKGEIDLRKHNIYSATAVATASDGNLWVYDPLSARLLKLDETGTEMSAGIDLRQQLTFVPKASFLIERDRRVYLCDTAQGILVFDQFATYITTLPFKGVSKLQAFDQQLVFAIGSMLHSYDMQTAAEKTIQLPVGNEQMIDVSLSQRLLAILYESRLALYAWPAKAIH